MKAYIKQDTKKSNALWLIVERSDEPPKSLGGLMGMFRDEDAAQNVAYPLLGDEILAIRDACEDWLERASQEEMKEEV
jgi:hypothetical protein